MYDWSVAGKDSFWIFWRSVWHVTCPVLLCYTAVSTPCSKCQQRHTGSRAIEYTRTRWDEKTFAEKVSALTKGGWLWQSPFVSYLFLSFTCRNQLAYYHEFCNMIGQRSLWSSIKLGLSLNQHLLRNSWVKIAKKNDNCLTGQCNWGEVPLEKCHPHQAKECFHCQRIPRL